MREMFNVKMLDHFNPSDEILNDSQFDDYILPV